MCSEFPKEFEKSTEVLPILKYGLATIQDLRQAENDAKYLEWLKKVGLSNEEVKLYQENEAGLLDQRKKVESSALKARVEELYNKINKYQSAGSCEQSNVEAGPSAIKKVEERFPQKSIKIYPKGHPINELKEIEEDLFGHLRNDHILPITKRLKLLRRLERKKERILNQQKQFYICPSQKHPVQSTSKPGSLWDVKEMPKKPVVPECGTSKGKMIGPRETNKYIIKGQKIVRLEPVQRNDDSSSGQSSSNSSSSSEDEYMSINIVMPVRPAEGQLLEGTKMCLDDIKKIATFKNYKPGIPSKVLYLKNIAPSVSEQQISLLFNQFLLDNGGPIDLRLLTGRMRGQAFVTFQNEDLAIRALDEVNGTILSGRPIVAQFGRASPHIQDNNR